MEGAWHLYRPGSRWRRPAFEARVVLGTAAVAGGRVRARHARGAAARARRRTSVGYLGPDLLGPDWDADEAIRRIEAEPRARDRPRAARPAQPRRRRQRVPERALLPPRRAADAAGRGGARPATDDRPREAAARGEQEPRRPHPHRRHPARAGRTGSTAATGQPCRRCGTRSCGGTLGDPVQPGRGATDRETYWCPRCQTPVTARDDRPMTKKAADHGRDAGARPARRAVHAPPVRARPFVEGYGSRRRASSASPRSGCSRRSSWRRTERSPSRWCRCRRCSI